MSRISIAPLAEHELLRRNALRNDAAIATRKMTREPNDWATVFGKTKQEMELTHGRTPEDHTPTKDRSPKKQPHDDREEIIAEAMVATGDAGKRRARSETRRLQADECEENRGVAQALRRT